MAEQPNQRRWNDSVSDLPAFHGNEKDTITAESITTRVEAAAEALAWDDAATFNNFSLAMRSNAEKWLMLQADIRPDFARSWTYIKPLFRVAFGTKMDKSKVFLALRELGHKPTELVQDFAIRFNESWRTIKSLMKPKIINVPAAEANRTIAVCQGLYAQGFLDAQMEFQRIMFVSTLDMPLLTKVVQKDIPTFVDAMETASKLQGLTQKPNGNGGVIHSIQEQNLETTDAEFVNQIQQGYHNNRGNNHGNSPSRETTEANPGETVEPEATSPRATTPQTVATTVTTVTVVPARTRALLLRNLIKKLRVCSARSSAIIKTTAANASTPANLVKQPLEKNIFLNPKCIQ